MLHMQIVFLLSIGVVLFLLLSLAGPTSNNLMNSAESKDREIAELRRRLKESEDCEYLLVEALEKATCWESVAKQTIREAGSSVHEGTRCLKNQITEERRR